jgi:hypothetical protein
MADEPKDAPPEKFRLWNAENADDLPGRHLMSIYVNRFHVLIGDEKTRIAFGESVVGENPGNWHVSVAMLNADAIFLAKSILEIAESAASAAADETEKE